MSRIVSIIVLCALMSDARVLDDIATDIFWTEIHKNIGARKTKELYKSIKFPIDEDRNAQPRRIQTLQNLPPAVTARYVVNQADWAAVATISTRKDVQSFPVANLISIADGPVGNGTGIPYMYLTPLDYTAQDLAKDHRATLLVSSAQTNYCKTKGYDPMDPRCARVMLTGKIKELKNETKDIVKQFFFARHPTLQHMPASHKFFFAELEILAISLLDTFGGPKYISVEDYLNAKPTVIRQRFLRRRKVAWPFIYKVV